MSQEEKETLMKWSVNPETANFITQHQMTTAFSFHNFAHLAKKRNLDLERLSLAPLRLTNQSCIMETVLIIVKFLDYWKSLMIKHEQLR